MARFNASVLLLVWAIILILLIGQPWPWIFLSGIVATLIALRFARAGFGSLLRRSKWLFLASLLMFGWMTPGMPVAWLPGATGDGLLQAVEQIARLTVSIAMVSLLLARLDGLSLLAACHGLLRPLGLLEIDVARWVLRLGMTLKQLDERSLGVSSDVSVIQFPRQEFRMPDLILIVFVFALLGLKLL